ncbi:MAG: hypothetical protein DI543_05135 [Bradyrhizobium icense]|nr:MAG: hypothetical protein DI543_05135 [Bradyrhizobium icense]
MPEVCIFIRPLSNRGRKEGRAPAGTRELRVQMEIRNAHGPTGTARTSRPSPRNGFTAYRCSPR